VVTLAEEFDLEVINADSRQILRYLDIGTAKPTPEECNKVRFHLVDIVEPGERYSAFRFIDDATVAIGDILARGKIPFVVGGTGLYLKALAEGVVEIEQEDMELRANLEADMEEHGPEEMHRRLEAIDPLEAVRIHPNNRVRVLRALELFYLTGKCKSELVETGAYRSPAYRYDFYCLQPERAELYRRINERVDQMMTDGLLDEVKSLCDRGLTEAIRNSRVIGYTELLDYLEGSRPLEEAVALIKQNSRRYAKRQMTWFRGQADCRYFDSSLALIDTIKGSEINFRNR